MPNDPKKDRHETPSDPNCPVCGGKKGCSTRESGQVFCRGTEGVTPDGWVDLLHGQPDSQGFHHYRRVSPSGSASATTAGGKAARKPKTPKPTNWSAKAIHYATELLGTAGAQKRLRLAAELGISPDGITAVPMVGSSGVTLAGLIMTVAEVDADGIPVGITERDPSREKKSQSLPGGERGLILPTAWESLPGPVLAVEGATDVLACAGAGLCVVGRPGATAKPELLGELLRKKLTNDPTRLVIVVGENDRKEDGRWPGRDGAEQTALKLASLIPNPVAWSLPPDGAKDARAWLSDPARGNMAWEQRGQVLLAGLQGAAVLVDREAVERAKEQAAREAQEREQAEREEAEDNPAKWSKSPTNPHRLAREYLATISPPDSPLRLRYWRGEFHEWQAGAYRTIDKDTMSGRIWAWVEGEFRRVYELEMKQYKLDAQSRTKRPQEEQATRNLIANVIGALQGVCQQGLDPKQDAPFWLDGAAQSSPPPTELVSCRNGLANIVTGELLPHTPSFFTFNAVPYDHDSTAPTPRAWMQFLASVFPGEADSIACLQEWLGYLLTADNSHQKMLFLFGEKRSGKGTVSRVIRELVGAENCTSTSYKNLDGDFGLWPLLGKSVGVIGDSREARGDEIGGTALERMLNITGQDEVLVDRKNLSMFSATLNLRFVVLSNDLPRVTDTSGAFVSRIVLLNFCQSFLGREDTGLLAKLLAELPGIFNWAVAGLRRLRERGRFVQPMSGRAKLNLVQAGASPITEFVGERCRLGAEYSVPCKELLDAWKKWCEENNRLQPGTAQTLGIKLASVPGCSQVERRRVRKDGNLIWCYVGIRLRDFYESDDDDAEVTPSLGANSVPDVLGLFPTVFGGQEQRKCNGDKGLINNVPDVPDLASTPIYTNSESSNSQEGESANRIYGTEAQSQEHRNKSAEVLANQVDNLFLTNETGQEHVGNIRNTCGGGFDYDLYFTDDIELIRYPTGSAAEVVEVGASLHYRVTPSTVKYLELAKDRAEPGEARDRLQSIMGELGEYLAVRYTPDQIGEAMREEHPGLPQRPRMVA